MDTVLKIGSWGLSFVVGLVSGASFMEGWYSWKAALFLLITRLRGIKGPGGFAVAVAIGRYEGYALFFCTILLGALILKHWVITANDSTVIFWIATIVAAGWIQPKAERISQVRLRYVAYWRDSLPIQWPVLEKTMVAMLLAQFFLRFFSSLLSYLLLR